MKQMARRYVWWPNINGVIENSMVQLCEQYLQAAKAPNVTYRPWPQTGKPRERIHLDFAGSFLAKMWLICIDDHSKFPFVVMLNVGQTTSKSTINVLELFFAIERLPDTIFTDNGTQFVSREFEQFCAKFNYRHVASAVFHLASNGETKKFVQSFKKGITKHIGKKRELVSALCIVMASYRTSPHPWLNWSTPAEVLHGRQPKNLLSLFSPGVKRGMPSSATDQKSRSDFASLVFARNYTSKNKWYPGKVTKFVGIAMCMIRTDRDMWKHHLNQLQPRLVYLKVPVPT